MLLEIARQPDGVLLGPAARSLANELGESPSACNTAIMELVADGLLIIKDDDETGERFLLANYDDIGVPADLRTRIVEAGMPVAVLGTPHGPGVVGRLRADLDTQTEVVYVCFDIASIEEYEGVRIVLL